MFPEYTPVPEAHFPVQIEQAHAAAMWARNDVDAAKRAFEAAPNRLETAEAHARSVDEAIVHLRSRNLDRPHVRVG